LFWRAPGFCDDARNARDEVCLSPNAAAITTVFYYDKPGDERDGEMVGVDIEVNAAHFSFSDDGEPGKLDLENTMTHEFGHVLGLDHTCNSISGAVPPVDGSGNPVPPCFPLADLSAAVTSATMFNFEGPGETSKRVPQADETDGVCAIYAGHSRECESSDTGCALVPRSRLLPLSAAGL